MSERQPYSRIYWSVLHDSKFDTVRADMRLFGSWALMLVVADMAYPAPAFLPPTVSKKAVQVLVDASLIDLVAGGMFTLRGLKRERERRADAATRKPNRDPDGTQLLPNRDPEGRIAESKAEYESVDEDETRQAETEAPRVPDPADVYWTLTGKYPNDKALSWIDDLAGSYGSEAVIRALAQAQINDKATNTLLGRTQDQLRSEARALTLKEQAAVRARLKEHRAEPKQERDEAAIRAEIRRLMEPGAAA